MRDHTTGGLIGRLIVLLAFVLGACSQSNPEAERSAYEASKPWIALMDEGEYEQCWDEAAPWFRDKVARDMWIAKAHETRDPLGEMAFRELCVEPVTGY